MTIVGAVRINKAQKYHYNNYECAAWWEERESQQGAIYPLEMATDKSFPNDLVLFSDMEVIVVDDYFPALWCGMSVGNKPYKPKHIGEKRTMRMPFTVEMALNQTGVITGEYDFEIFLDPFHWQTLLDDTHKQLERAMGWINKDFEEYKNDKGGLGSLGYDGKKIAKAAKLASRFNERMGYMEHGYLIDLHNKNTAWAREFLDIGSFTNWKVY